MSESCPHCSAPADWARRLVDMELALIDFERRVGEFMAGVTALRSMAKAVRWEAENKR